MATLVMNKKGLLKQMLAKKKQLEAHLKKPNEVPKLEGIEFVKPFSVSASGK
jgi:hypothetical protein